MGTPRGRWRRGHVGDGLRIEVEGLSKSFGDVRAVDALSLSAEPGEITGFLGPNGAGKTTTLRMLLGLVEPSGGKATIGRAPYALLDNPADVVGAALEAPGMRQRLGLATALVGDPPVLVLDEPSKGLDPEGIDWLRGFLKRLAGEGRTMLVSSHALLEVQQIADRVVYPGGRVLVTTPDAERFARALKAASISMTHRVAAAS